MPTVRRGDEDISPSDPEALLQKKQLFIIWTDMLPDGRRVNHVIGGIGKRQMATVCLDKMQALVYFFQPSGRLVRQSGDAFFVRVMVFKIVGT